MRILVLNHDYRAYLNWFYQTNPWLADASYEEQQRVRQESLFGTAYFYPNAFEAAGHEAYGVYVNNEHMQTAWAEEHAIGSEGGVESPLDRVKSFAADTPLRRLEPLVRAVAGDQSTRPSWYYDVLDAQIGHYDPDVVLNLAVDGISPDFVSRMGERVDLVVGQIAAPVPDWVDVERYDLMVSALPQFVDRFHRQGVDSAYVKLAFEPSVLDCLDEPDGRDIPVSFVGSLSAQHESRIRFLERLAERVPLRVWAPAVDSLASDSPLRECYEGQAWGREMLEVLRQSRVVVNNHVDVAGGNASNLRLYEATGVGSLLVTDGKRNIDQHFEPDEEVVAYETVDECTEAIQYYLNHWEEREQIASAGKARTFDEHTYANRIADMEAMFESRLDAT